MIACKRIGRQIPESLRAVLRQDALSNGAVLSPDAAKERNLAGDLISAAPRRETLDKDGHSEPTSPSTPIPAILLTAQPPTSIPLNGKSPAQQVVAGSWCFSGKRPSFIVDRSRKVVIGSVEPACSFSFRCRVYLLSCSHVAWRASR